MNEKATPKQIEILRLILDGWEIGIETGFSPQAQLPRLRLPSLGRLRLRRGELHP